MGKEELQNLVSEMQDICDELSFGPKDVYSQTSSLIRLSTCMGSLKAYPCYSPMADEVLSSIQDYASAPGSLETIIAETGELISILTEEAERDSVLDTLKKGYAEAKDKVAEVIPEEVKDACKEAAKQAKGIYQDTAQQAKEVRKKAEKKAKSKLRSWLLSDDEE